MHTASILLKIRIYPSIVSNLVQKCASAHATTLTFTAINVYNTNAYTNVHITSHCRHNNSVEELKLYRV